MAKKAKKKKTTGKKKKKAAKSSRASGKGRGSKAAYSSKQQRMAEHIEDGYEKKGASKKKAQRIAWATVNKETGGARGKSKKSSRSSGKAKPYSEQRA